MKVLAIDQGTTETKAFTLDDSGELAAVASRRHAQHFPHPGWVEHDAGELLASVRDCIAAGGKVDALGIDNQGETVVAWDARTGEPCGRAIVWQDNRTQDVAARLKAQGAEALTLARAGLPLDPYFAASKLRWIIDHQPGAKELLGRGCLRLGTSDAYFLDRLTGVFATDVTTASRTSLMSLDTLAWDEDLLALFGVPRECLPEIRSTTGPFGAHGGIEVTASLVDQQAALFGHGCAEPGDAKITFGTGAFALAIAGATRLPASKTGLSETVAWKIGTAPAPLALEGGVYNAASAVNWAKGLGLFTSYDEIAAFARGPALSRGLVFVPALSGLAAPHWDRRAAGLWIGLGLDTSRSDLMQAMLEGIAMRAVEVIDAMEGVLPIRPSLSIDGGLARNAYFAQTLSNAADRIVTIAASTELTGLGTARMAMLGLGAVELPPRPGPLRIFEPDGTWPVGWRAPFSDAVGRAKGWRHMTPS